MKTAEMREATYAERLCTPAEAVRLVKSGDRVYVGSTSSMAYRLCEALAERESELEDVRIGCSQFRRPSALMDPDSRAFRPCSYFMGTGERACLDRGGGEFSSIHLSQIDRWCRETLRPNVAFLEVSPPDGEGYMSFGATGVALHRRICELAQTVILQVNRNVPYTYGEESRIHFSEATRIVEADDVLETVGQLPLDDTVRAISDHILPLIPDGATIQLGLGGVANAVGYGLREKNDLGIHSEMMSDSMMHLMQAGNVNNRRKSLLPGKSVVGFAFGSSELYRFLDHNEDMYFMPFRRVNDPVLIAQNDRMISINTAMCVDLFGQVSSESVGFRQYSATGGQLDFVRGAQNARDGKSFIAISSTQMSRSRGRISKIVPCFEPGTVVTTPRSDVQYVATEFGCVNLKPLSMRDRVRAMIGLAHPDFRDELSERARAAGIL